jgi:hypothetical protein
MAKKPLDLRNHQMFIPTVDEVSQLLIAKYGYETTYNRGDSKEWQKKNFKKTPWGIAWMVSPKGKTPDEYKAFRYLLAALLIDWQDLVVQLKRTIGQSYGRTAQEIEEVKNQVWTPNVSFAVASVNTAGNDVVAKNQLKESIEKHDELNPKLFAKDGKLKADVREKMLEIVDEFAAELALDAVELAVEDVLFIGSNASYNYTKDSDIDLHILVDGKKLDCSPEIATALYSAYRSLFKNTFEIEFFDIPVELYVETEETARVSNGVYSVKNDEWLKEPVQEDIPDVDKDAINKEFEIWEDYYEELKQLVKADKLPDETRVVKLIEDIYELRKTGIADGEYSTGNLVFKELRNAGILDDLKKFKAELVTKRLSLTEALGRAEREKLINEIAHIAGTQPLVQENGYFFLYNIKEGVVNRITQAIRNLDGVESVRNYASGKVDFDFVNPTNPGQYARRFTISGKLID